MDDAGPLARLSAPQIQQLQRVFYALDKDEDGEVGQADLEKVLRSLGRSDAKTEAEQYLHSATVGTQTRDGEALDATQFLTMMGTHLAPFPDMHKILEAFASFDERDEGWIDVAVVQSLLADDPEAVRGVLTQLAHWLAPPFLDRTRSRFAYRQCTSIY